VVSNTETRVVVANWGRGKILVPSEHPGGGEEGRLRPAGPARSGTLEHRGPRSPRGPGGCHGDAGSAARRRRDKAARQPAPLRARAPPPRAPLSSCPLLPLLPSPPSSSVLLLPRPSSLLRRCRSGSPASRRHRPGKARARRGLPRPAPRAPGPARSQPRTAPRTRGPQTSAGSRATRRSLRAIPGPRPGQVAGCGGAPSRLALSACSQSLSLFLSSLTVSVAATESLSESPLPTPRDFLEERRYGNIYLWAFVFHVLFFRGWDGRISGKRSK
jgi:hypothetical protein